MTNIENAINNNELKKLIALQVRKQIDAVLRELLTLEEELTFK